MSKHAFVVLLGLSIACGGDDAGNTDASTSVDSAVQTVDAPPAEDLDMQAADFGCIKNGTKVRRFYLWNALGHLDDALAVASSATGGSYPVGTLIQLVPFEAMVKRRSGWNPTTNDWEFFSLAINGTTTTIDARGTENVVNQFGGNCFDCHSKAAPQWDLVCETTHGCDPLPLTEQQITNIQDADSRCP